MYLNPFFIGFMMQVICIKMRTFCHFFITLVT